MEIEQGNREGLQRSEWEGLNAGLVGRAEGAAAVLKQAEGKSEGFGLAAFFLTLLKTFLTAFLGPLAVPAQRSRGKPRCS